MSNFQYLKLSDKLSCQTGVTVYGVLHPEDLSSASDSLGIEEQDSLRFAFSRVNRFGEPRPIAAAMRAGRVLTVVWDDHLDEWRVGAVEMGRGQGGLISVEGVSLVLDLAERADSTGGKGWVSELLSGGERNFEYEIAERTPSSILSTYVIPNLPSWITLGTVDPTVVIPAISVSRLTPWALAGLTRDALREMDVPCELRLRRNGTTDYKLDLVTQIGASAAVPVFHPRMSLLSLKQRTDPALQATRILVRGGTAPDTFPGILGRARWKGGAPSGLVVALTDRNGGASPVAFTDQWVNTYLLRVKTGRTFKITASNATNGTVTLETTVSTIAADEDFEFRLTEPLTNTRSTTTRYAISAVSAGVSITCGVSNPISVNDQYRDWYARVWSLASGGTIILDHVRITGTVASTDVISINDTTGVTTSHFVEFIQLDGAGEQPAYVDHPLYIQADPTGYGVKAGELTRANNLGITQLIPNPWMRTWSNSANPPDGWARTSVDITSPVFYPVWDAGHTRLSVRCWVYFAVFTTNINAALRVYPANADGTANTNVTLGSCLIQPTDGTNAATKVATGAWVELRVDGITLVGDGTSLTKKTPYGAVGRLEVATGGVFARETTITRFGGFSQRFTAGATVDGYLDTIESYPFLTCPDASYEFGDAVSLTQGGNRKLAEVASPPIFYEMSALDLERAFPAEYPRLLTTVGGNIRAADLEYGTDVTIRLLRRERNLLEPTETRFTLANRPTLLTDLVQAGITKPQTEPVSALVSSGGAAAVLTAPAAPLVLSTFSAATTIPAGSAVTTNTTQVLTVDQGGAVTYVPTVSTNPTTTVAPALPGAAPRPRRFT